MRSLAVLIPTLNDRRRYLNVLHSHIAKQIGERDVQIITNYTGREMSIGAKRQMMLENCKADYICFVDDDDMVSTEYISLIYDAIQKEPDVVGMRGIITIDGGERFEWCISTKYDWAENQDGFRYVRYPNHLAPIRRELALQAGFKDMGHGEDYDYSMRLKELGKLKKEEFIDEELYYYYYKSKK